MGKIGHGILWAFIGAVICFIIGFIISGIIALIFYSREESYVPFIILMIATGIGAIIGFKEGYDK